MRVLPDTGAGYAGSFCQHIYYQLHYVYQIHGYIVHEGICDGRTGITGYDREKNKIPLVDENGKQTGKHFQLNMPEISKVDAGVYEMKVSWKRYTRYAEDAVILARRFFANGTPIDSENGEGGEDA